MAGSQLGARRWPGSGAVVDGGAGKDSRLARVNHPPCRAVDMAGPIQKAVCPGA